MLTSPARLCRPCHLAGPAHAAATAGFSIREGEMPRETDCLLERGGFELLVPQFSTCCVRPAFLRRISARLSKELDGFRRTPRFVKATGSSNIVTSGLAEFDPVLRAPLPQSRLLRLVREIVPPTEGAPPHQQILVSAVSTSSAEDVANFVVIDGQELTSEIQDQRLAKIELSLVRN